MNTPTYHPISCEDLKAKALEAVRLENDQRKREKEAHVAARHQAVMTQFAPIFPMLKVLPNGLYDLCGYQFAAEYGMWLHQYALVPTCNPVSISFADNSCYITDLTSFGRYLKLIEKQKPLPKPPAFPSITYHEEPGIVPRWLRRLFGCD